METQSFYYARGLRTQDAFPPPYGGLLVQSFLSVEERARLAERADTLPRLSISASELLDLELISSGAFSPLTGFMTQPVYASVLANSVLPDGRPWGLPVTLAVNREAALSIRSGQEAALYRGDEWVGVMLVEEIFAWDAAQEAQALDGAQDAACVSERRARRAHYLVGGPVALLATRATGMMLSGHRWPQEQRVQFGQRGWQRVATAHMRLPWLRAHEYLLKCALEASDGLLLHTSVEPEGRAAAAPMAVLAAASRQLVENYFPLSHVTDNPLPVNLLTPHPRAVLTHAIVSQNYGVASLFVPATHAEASLNADFNAAARHGLSIQPVFMPPAFYCEACGGMATDKSCPHDAAQQQRASEDQVLAQLVSGEPLSPLIARAEIIRSLSRALAVESGAAPLATQRHIHPHAPEVSRELRQAVIGHKAGVLWMTGLSGSGKSTIAHRLERELLLSGHRVFVLDGDTLRHGLNHDLGFSAADRRENLRRAAEVAKVLAEAGMIVIASFISPFRAEREAARAVLGGHFHEVYVEAGLEACEQRDPKGLYQRARAGEIPDFTGISSPYEAPEQPALTLNTVARPLEDCVQQLREYLAQHGLTNARTPAARGTAPGAGPIRLQS